MAKLMGIEAVVNKGKFYPAGPGVVKFDVVVLDPLTNNRVLRADAGDVTHKDVVGIVTDLFGDGRVLVEGTWGKRIYNAAWAWVRGQDLWLALGTPGGLTATPPHAGRLQRVAIANSPTEITLLIDPVLQ